MNRKYRQGYSLSFSSNKSEVKTHKNIEEYRNEIKADAIIDEKRAEIFSCSNNIEPQIINYKPTPIIFVCDTTPKKSVDEQRLLNEPKKPKGNDTTKKHLEPFNLASLIVLLLIIIFGENYFWALEFPLILILFALNIISFVRTERNPKKYYLLSKILAMILLMAIIFLAIFILIAFVFIYTFMMH